MSFRNQFVVSATKCLALCGALRADSFVVPLLLSPISPLTQQQFTNRRFTCCTTAAHHMEPQGGGKVGGDNETPPAAGVQSESVLQREVRAAVDKLNWPTLAARGWVPVPALAAIPPPEGRGGRGGGDGVVGDQCDDNEINVGAGAGRGGTGLKLLSWNVLCDGLSGAHPTRGGFLMAPEGSLDWDKRRWKLLEEILKWDCDVLVLQEVDHHHDWLSPMLAKEGYRSLFVKKPIAPGITFNPHLEDGCSLFYRATTATTAVGDGDGDRGGGASTAIGGQGFDDRQNVVKTSTTAAKATTLDLLDAHTFTLAVVEQDDGSAEEESAGDGDKGQKNPAEPVAGNQVALISLLSVSSAGGGGGGGGGGGDGGETLVIVTTTHLKAAKDGHGEMIRVRQAKQLLDEVARFRAGHEQARGLPAGSIPLIVAGDFNATPHKSGGYDPLCYEQVTAHPLALRSALPVGDDFFTTWKIRPAKPPPEGGAKKSKLGVAAEAATRESKHCIDYVWVSGGMQPTRRSTLPSAEALGTARAPSFVYPSDHFAIAVDLRLP